MLHCNECFVTLNQLLVEICSWQARIIEQSFDICFLLIRKLVFIVSRTCFFLRQLLEGFFDFVEHY